MKILYVLLIIHSYFERGRMAYKSYSSGNIYRISLLLLLVYKLFGLATFSINKQRNSPKKCLKHVVLLVNSKLGVSYNLLFSCLIIALNYLTVPAIIGTEYAYKTIVTTIIETFQGILGSIVICLTLLSYCVNQSAIIRIGNYLILIEDALRRLHQPLNRKHILRVLLIFCSLNLILGVGVSVTELSFNFNYILLISNVLPGIFVGFLFIQYFFVLTLINAIFVNLNCAIQDLYQNRFDDVSLYHSRRVFINFPAIYVLVQIRNIHNLVCDISNEISQFYSFPTLIALSLIFLSLLYDMYYLLEILIIENETLDFLILINSLLWIIVLLYPLGLLTSKGTELVNEVGI